MESNLEAFDLGQKYINKKHFPIKIQEPGKECRYDYFLGGLFSQASA